MANTGHKWDVYNKARISKKSVWHHSLKTKKRKGWLCNRLTTAALVGTPGLELEEEKYLHDRRIGKWDRLWIQGVSGWNTEDSRKISKTFHEKKLQAKIPGKFQAIYSNRQGVDLPNSATTYHRSWDFSVLHVWQNSAPEI